MLSFFPRDVLDEIWDLIESVPEGFPSYSRILVHEFCHFKIFVSTTTTNKNTFITGAQITYVTYELI